MRTINTLLLSLVLVSTQAHADFIFSAPPRESAEQGQALYGPIAEYLSAVLGERVTYEHPSNWGRYASEMREGRYDIVFDGPHFAAWRIKNLDHQPLARLPGQLRFAYLGAAGPDAPSGLDDLLQHKVCIIPPPNFTAVVVLANTNPVARPQLVNMSGGNQGVYQGLQDGKCSVAVVRDLFYDNLPETERARFPAFLYSDSYPNQTVTAGPRLTAEQQQSLREALTHENAALAPLLNRFANGSPSLVTTGRNEFNGYQRLLQGVVWGW